MTTMVLLVYHACSNWCTLIYKWRKIGKDLKLSPYSRQTLQSCMGMGTTGILQ